MIQFKDEKDLKALQATLRKCKHINTVYFTCTGDHYFDAHELGEKKYGYLAMEPTLIDGPQNTKLTKMKHVGVEDAEIVQELSREEVLEFAPEAEIKNNKGKGKGKKEEEKDPVPVPEGAQEQNPEAGKEA